MSTATPLSAEHRRQLEGESGISPEIIAERGYRTIKRRDELEAFPEWQRRLGLLIPTRSADEKTTRMRLRPNLPRKGRDGKLRKYEHPHGAGCILDVHPRNHEAVKDVGVDLWVTEGEKKADALTSQGLCTIALFGVWNFQRGGELLPCWDHVALKGRRVYVIFDADAMVKENVQLALERLVGMLEARDAEVLVVYLPGPEKGVDDYLVAGHTVNELKMLARKFDPKDVGWIRLSRDEKLRIALEDLYRRFWAEEWRGMGGHTDRDVALKLMEAAMRHGKVVDGGIRVTKAQGPLWIEAKVSSRTGWKALKRLEDMGFLRRDNEGRKSDKSGAFVLRASVSHMEGKASQRGKGLTTEQGYDPGDLHLRAPFSAPRLRWSRPKWKPSPKAIREHRLGTRRAPLPEPRERITRLGKIRGAILDALESAGGTASLKEIAVALHKKRPRDIRRRNLPMLEDSGIVTLSEDRNTVSLTKAWLEALEDQRELGMEIEADELARRRYEKKKDAYNNRHKCAADEAPTEEEMDAARERREKRRKEEEERPVSPLAAAIHDYLSKTPGDACQPAGWIGNTLWANDLFPGKPTPAEAKAAIEELGGERYLRDCLERHRTGAPPPPPKTIKEDAQAPSQDPPPDTSPDPPAEEECKTHQLDCECDDCLIPEPRYARPYTNVAGAA